MFSRFAFTVEQFDKFSQKHTRACCNSVIINNKMFIELYRVVQHVYVFISRGVVRTFDNDADVYRHLFLLHLISRWKISTKVTYYYNIVPILWKIRICVFTILRVYSNILLFTMILYNRYYNNTIQSLTNSQLYFWEIRDFHIFRNKI